MPNTAIFFVIRFTRDDCTGLENLHDRLFVPFRIERMDRAGHAWIEQVNRAHDVELELTGLSSSAGDAAERSERHSAQRTCACCTVQTAGDAIPPPL
jgi:hypothetical protein